VPENIKWTAEKRVENPAGYCQAKMKELSKMSEKLEENYVQLGRAFNRLDNNDSKHSKHQQWLTAFVEEAKAKYRQAEATGKWPVVVQGETFSKDRLQEKIIDASRRLEELGTYSPETANKLAKLKQQHQCLFEEMQRISSLRKKTNRLLADLRDNDRMETSRALKSSLDDLEDAVKSMSKEVNSLSLATLALPTADEKMTRMLTSIIND
jgi:chromosome segregation ATPase